MKNSKTTQYRTLSIMTSYLPTETVQELTEIADHNNTSRNKLVNDIIHGWLKEYKSSLITTDEKNTF